MKKSIYRFTQVPVGVVLMLLVGISFSFAKTTPQIDEKNATSVERAFGYNKMYKKGTYGWLYVASIPNKAVVYVNGKRQSGVTPNKFKLPTGTVKVSVVIPGKAKQDFSGVKILSGKTTTLQTVDFRDNIVRSNTDPLMD